MQPLNPNAGAFVFPIAIAPADLFDLESTQAKSNIMQQLKAIDPTMVQGLEKMFHRTYMEAMSTVGKQLEADPAFMHGVNEAMASGMSEKDAERSIKRELLAQEEYKQKVQEQFNEQMNAQMGLKGFSEQEEKLSRSQMVAEKIGHLSSALQGIGMSAQMAGESLANMGLGTLGSIVSSLGSAFIFLSTAISGAASMVQALGKDLGAFFANPWVMGIAAGIAALSALVIVHKRVTEKIKEDAKKVVDTYKDGIEETNKNLSKLEEYRTQFLTLSQGVDENGNNVSLGTEEYQDYKRIVDEMIAMKL